MGKIKVATLGGQNEDKSREEKRVKREEKKKRQQAGKTHVAGMKGGQRVKVVGAMSEEEINKMANLAEEVEKDQNEGIKTAVPKEKFAKRRARTRGQKYKEARMKVEVNKLYPIGDALVLLREVSLTKFDPTVEVHINTIDKGLRGKVQLPHGTGKEIKVMVVDGESIEKLLEAINKGDIDFDALVAHPSVMPRLVTVAKFLGPRGLMPNPKTGTLSAKPEEVAAKMRGGEISWKTETDFPIIHMRIGKLSFKDKQLEENFRALVKSIGDTKIRNITLKSTMSPGIKVQIQ